MLAQIAGRRRQRSVERRIDESGLRVRKTLAAFDWNFQPGIDRAAIEELALLGFVRRGQDLVITGKSGTGKSHILQALALCACEAGLIVRYTRFADLLGELHAGLADGSYDRRLRRWARADLVVLDDVGLGQVPTAGDMPSAAHMLWSLVDLRHERRATAITSNIKLSAWGRYLGDATVTAAVLDRLAMTSLRIDIDGPSWRQRAAKERAGVDPSGDSDGDDEEAPEVPGHE